MCGYPATPACLPVCIVYHSAAHLLHRQVLPLHIPILMQLAFSSSPQAEGRSKHSQHNHLTRSVLKKQMRVSSTNATHPELPRISGGSSARASLSVMGCLSQGQGALSSTKMGPARISNRKQMRDCRGEEAGGRMEWGGVGQGGGAASKLGLTQVQVRGRDTYRVEGLLSAHVCLSVLGGGGAHCDFPTVCLVEALFV